MTTRIILLGALIAFGFPALVGIVVGLKVGWVNGVVAGVGLAIAVLAIGYKSGMRKIKAQSNQQNQNEKGDSDNV